MEHGKSCCFSGHRPSKLPWGYDESDPRCVEFKEKLSAVIGAVYDSGIKHFICGMALGCDMYCAEAVIRLKKMHSDVTLQAAVPYRGQADSWNEYNRLRYDRIVDNCDEVTVLAESYSPACMAIRNRFMVDNSSVLVACYDGMSGGTWNTIRYAQKKDIEVIQLPIELKMHPSGAFFISSDIRTDRRRFRRRRPRPHAQARPALRSRSELRCTQRRTFLRR